MRNSNKSARSAKVAHLCGFSLLVLSFAAWSDPPATTGPSEVAEESASIAAPLSGSSEFEVPAGMLDTWNAIGQILVGLDGVTYEGRAQMLGLYAVQYQGERFLILTKGRVLQSPAERELTYVRALLRSGATNRGAPAVELMGHLRQRLPTELARIAAIQQAGPQTAGLNPP